MTLEEAIQLAENGDVGAMLSLGDYYMQQNTGEAVEEAIKWYEMAANQNVIYAVHMTVLGKKILAYGGVQAASNSEFGVDFLFEDWEEVYNWAARELQLINEKVPGAEKIDIEDAVKNFDEASYYLALCYYWKDNYEEAKELVSDIDDMRSRMLYGAALLQSAKTNEEAIVVFNRLVAIIRDSEYAKSFKSNLEENVYALVALQLSMMYRNVGSQSDMEAAVSVLSFVFDKIKYDNNKQIIGEELSHYQKKLFGGYKYV